MHLTCLVDTARLSIVVTETISSRDGDNLPALRMAASTTGSGLTSRMPPRRAYSQPPAISNADERMQALSASISVIYIRISCHGMFGCRVSYRRIETQSVRVSRHFVNCIHKRCTDCRPIIGNSLHVRLRSFCCNRHYVFASSVGACCPSSTVSASVSRYRQGFMQDFISGV